MLKSIEMTGATRDIAIQKALDFLQMDRDDVSVEVLDNGKKGFLGIGATDAKVRVTYEAPDEPAREPETAPKAEEKPAEDKKTAPSGIPRCGAGRSASDHPASGETRPEEGGVRSCCRSGGEKGGQTAPGTCAARTPRTPGRTACA